MRTMAKEEKMGSAELFVKLENPSEFRRTLLEGRRDIIQTLERYEMLRAIRVKKVEYMSQLKNIVKDVQSLLDELKNVLPKTPVREKVEKKASIKALKDLPKKRGSELTELEEELKNIQAKLDLVG